MNKPAVIGGAVAALLGFALVGCSTSGGSAADATERVQKACTAFTEADAQTIETVGPFLDTMVSESAAAADADSQYQAFADATVVLNALVTAGSDESADNVEDDFSALVEALEVVESTCSASE